MAYKLWQALKIDWFSKNSDNDSHWQIQGTSLGTTWWVWSAGLQWGWVQCPWSGAGGFQGLSEAESFFAFVILYNLRSWPVFPKICYLLNKKYRLIFGEPNVASSWICHWW